MMKCYVQFRIEWLRFQCRKRDCFGIVNDITLILTWLLNGVKEKWRTFGRMKEGLASKIHNIEHC